VVIGLCRNLIWLCRADDPPLAREATAGSPARQAGQSNWSAPTQGPVGLKLAELVSTRSYGTRSPVQDLTRIIEI
jgi:hypothetical protein